MLEKMLKAIPLGGAGQSRQEKLFWVALGLLRPFWPLAAFATAIGILGGLASAWLLATINSSLHDADGFTVPLLARFAGLCALSVGGTAISGAINSILGQKIIAALRKDIAAQILQAPIASLEAHRSYRLMSVLTGDVDTVSAFTFNFSGYAIALAITVGGFAYLLTLSPAVFLLALVSLATGLAVNIISQRVWIRDYQAVRVAQDELHMQYRAIIDGAKELKISRPRRERVFDVLLRGAADRIAELKSRAMRLHWIADASGSAAFFVMIGLLLTARNQLGIDTTVISGAVIVLLYVKGPMEQIAGALPVFDQARISFSRIAALSADLDQREPNILLSPELGSGTNGLAIRSIELRGVRYAFPAGNDVPPFVLGPVDLTIHAGELLFIVGDNGSGKTTLIKLLLGLYVPQQGSILLDGVVVTPEDRDHYRQLFSTIFSDYYLFDDLAYGALPEEAGRHLARLGIAHKVTLDGDRFTTTDLSSGQRKRLALVQAWLEHRPIIVTDEWAADQDPDFRRIFYEELLPEMTKQGRTLIVISHDDRYFHVADRIVRMVNGHIVEDRIEEDTLVQKESR
ncbi:cyclic peptide export ABC transporter [Rhizobium miluonense]|jgi:putative ATP-binding cassette transporter|uniref:ATP-binding cassette transporter n=1 Tax=Rhizobium miluonense TaxID=411945 RepID=A0ABU1SXW9_9HYPH|nr:cyclic peptide export ABC transporter [Rhizobium miluonense]MDR6903804.1 putative ATP-binding cassette transporter [Rhizobium miluonense]